MAGRSLVPPLPLYGDEASKALRIFKRLKLPDVIGTPNMAEAAGEWFFPIVEALFGSYDVKTQRRMLQEFFLLVPKKNGKSSYAAAIMVVALIVNRRPLAEFLLVAPTKEIADIAFKQAQGIINCDPELKKLFLLQRHVRLITHRNSGATLQIKASDTEVITGSKATGTLIDETHVFAKKSNAADVFVEIRGALAARPDGFLLQITTQSKEQPAGVFRSELSKARAVRDGQLAFPLLPVLYELPDALAKNGGWKQPEYWPLVNPNMGRSVDLGFLERELLSAEREGMAQLALFASQHFNVEIGLGLKTDRWRGADYWLAAADRTLNLAELIRRCEVIVAGVDGGGEDDLLALCLMGRERGTRRWLCVHWTWVHRSVLELRKSEASRFLDFERAGELRIVDSLLVAFAELASVVQTVEESGLLDRIGMDPMGVGLIVEAMAEAGIDRERVVAVSQGWKLNGAIKAAEVKLGSGELKHDGLALTAWAVGNAKVEPKGNAVTITKQNAGTAKIDPLMALCDCVAVMTSNPESPQMSESDIRFF